MITPSGTNVIQYSVPIGIAIAKKISSNLPEYKLIIIFLNNSKPVIPTTGIHKYTILES